LASVRTLFYFSHMISIHVYVLCAGILYCKSKKASALIVCVEYGLRCMYEYRNCRAENFHHSSYCTGEQVRI
jgi:hypothetical protein